MQRMKKKTINLSLFIILCSFIQALSFAEENKNPFKYIEEKEEIQEFIKLHRRAILGDVDSKETQIARFSVGEYYFKHNQLFDSRGAFRKYANDYPPQISSFIAKIFLFKIAKLQNDIEKVEELKREIFGKSFIILFSDYKVLEYISAFGNNYTVHYYVNKVELFLNDELFEKVEP